jgi:enoyl-CoA hydratase/carnithine racemase
MTTVLKEDHAAVRRLVLNRPEKLNAMNAELVDTLIDELEKAEADATVAVIVLAGAGRAFSAGADIRSPTSPDPRAVLAGAARTTRLYQLLLALDTPLVAEVHGYVLGGGCNVAVSCDLVVAAENAVFGYPELEAGLAATAVAPPLVHQIGRKAAFELLTLCEKIPAARALELGMINRVVPNDQVSAAALEVAGRLAGFDHDALWMTKRTIRRAADLPLPAALEMAADAGVEMRLFSSEGR